MDFKLVEDTQEMRDKWLHDEIMDKGLLGAVKEQLDEWVSICHPLGYQGFSEAIERAQNITDLIKNALKLSVNIRTLSLLNMKSSLMICQNRRKIILLLV